MNAHPARWIRHVVGQLEAAGGRYRQTTRQTKRDWHRLLDYNAHDCLALRHVTLRASRQLEAWRAYLRTKYCFDEGRATICFRAGARPLRLDALLQRHRAATWAFITAWNPGSIALSAGENTRRQAQLLRDLRAYTVLPGEGIGDDPAWDPEASLMVLGISRARAITLARKYGQLAIVTGSLGSRTELVSCATTPARFRRPTAT